MLTARADVASRVEGLYAGAADYVTKPFDVQELLARVHARLRERRVGDDVVEHAGVRLHVATRAWPSATPSAALPELEVELLRLLLAHPGGSSRATTSSSGSTATTCPARTRSRSSSTSCASACGARRRRRDPDGARQGLHGAVTRAAVARPPAVPAPAATRLGLIVVGAVVAALVAAPAGPTESFGRSQRAQLEDLLSATWRGSSRCCGRDARRGLRRPGAGGVRLQFVSTPGRVVLPADGQAPIPLADGADAVRPGRRGRARRQRRLAAPLRARDRHHPDGARRREADAARRDLRAGLWASGAVVALLAGAVALALLGGALGRSPTWPRRPSPSTRPTRASRATAGPDDEVAEVAGR
jgi:CheY-like chemotaxis protein